ncbi:FecR family protein [Alteromonas gilva]|uniref:FecR domain-containing protein n=1 Tax=Alteromonas gilva TaxID=2987522 RepID=A0ABT5L4E0_9ALTE|nr:FecR domain-containing protein [Alteromonas gilva]MDC8831912.1 FecR domain-containing protein [Alteromonas gilva]
MNSQPISSDVYQQAGEWLERLDNGPLDKLSKRRFINWVDAHPTHKQAFESMLATWSSAALERALIDAQQNITLKERIRYTPPVRWWQAAVLCTAVIVGVITWQFSSPQPTLIIHQYATDNGEVRSVTLEDSSVLTLGAASDVYVRLSDNHRLVNLKQGAAYFDVTSNKQRPFEVKVGSASVVAVGTEFNIDRGQYFTDVVVHEGAVEVTGGPDESPLLLKAGEQVRITGRTLGDIRPFDIRRTLDWRSGWLELDNASLHYLVERLNRQSAKAIRVDAPALNDLRVAGRFRLNEPQQALSLLAEAYGLSVNETPEYYTISRHP